MEQEKPKVDTVENSVEELQQMYSQVEHELQGLIVGLMELSKQIKKLGKNTQAVIKSSSKKKKTPKKEVSANIDHRLMKFMKLSEPKATRSEALRKISEYVRDTNLQLADDKRKFVTDNTLATLLNIPKGETMTFLAINKYVTPLFKTDSVVAETPAKVIEVKSTSATKKASKKVVKN